MAFDATIITVAWLATFELPSETLRLCDGGTVTWGSDRFESSHPDFGVIGDADPPQEGSADEMPNGTITFLPASTAAAATLSQPTFQSSPIRLWLAEVDPDTGAVDGTPELVADCLLDTTTLILEEKSRQLEMGLVTSAEKLFLANEGNTLSSRFHTWVWPGELGFDNATGVGIQVAWGVTSPPRKTVTTSAGGGGGSFAERVLARLR